jgi:hypothetical protein
MYLATYPISFSRAARRVEREAVSEARRNKRRPGLISFLSVLPSPHIVSSPAWSASASNRSKFSLSSRTCSHELTRRRAVDALPELKDLVARGLFIHVRPPALLRLFTHI